MGSVISFATSHRNSNPGTTSQIDKKNRLNGWLNMLPTEPKKMKHPRQNSVNPPESPTIAGDTAAWRKNRAAKKREMQLTKQHRSPSEVADMVAPATVIPPPALIDDALAETTRGIINDPLQRRSSAQRQDMTTRDNARRVPPSSTTAIEELHHAHTSRVVKSSQPCRSHSVPAQTKSKSVDSQAKRASSRSSKSRVISPESKSGHTKRNTTRTTNNTTTSK
jgi:hypothetical protein